MSPLSIVGEGIGPRLVCIAHKTKKDRTLCEFGLKRAFLKNSERSGREGRNVGFPTLTHDRLIVHAHTQYPLAGLEHCSNLYSF